MISLKMDTEELRFRRLREAMVVHQIEGRGIKEPHVLKAMRTVKRHHFVPKDLHKQAYEDRPLPIGAEQTISQPYIVALMTELLSPNQEDVILEVGTGSGYQAAILAELCAQVYSIDISEKLIERARKILAYLGYTNVHLQVKDGYEGVPEKAPFDAIVVTCAAPKPARLLIDQLKEGGKMVAPIGPTGGVQELTLFSKGQERVEMRKIAPVRFVPMV